MRIVVALAVLAGLSLPAAAAETCPGHPDAIGTSRTITVDPEALPRIGTMQYKQSLPLEDHEVVITFDDGPLPPYTDRILAILAENCVKVDYFLVGTMAKAYPAAVRRIYEGGHVIGTHSLHHPLTFNRLGEAGLEREVDGGIAAVDTALGEAKAVAPFFRIPGLLRSKETDSYLAEKHLATFSADEVADDWHHGITPKQIVKIAMRRIEAKGHRGVLLLHDIHPATVMALPLLLKELKENGYKIVQAVPAGERPVLPAPAQTVAKTASAAGWPRVLPESDPRPVSEASTKVSEASSKVSGASGKVVSETSSKAASDTSRKHGARHVRHGRKRRHDDAVASAIEREQTSHTAMSGFMWPGFFAR